MGNKNSSNRHKKLYEIESPMNEKIDVNDKTPEFVKSHFQINTLDPRSPSVGIERTPIRFNENSGLETQNTPDTPDTPDTPKLSGNEKSKVDSELESPEINKPKPTSHLLQNTKKMGYDSISNNKDLFTMALTPKSNKNVDFTIKSVSNWSPAATDKENLTGMDSPIESSIDFELKIPRNRTRALSKSLRF